jgi:copper chaperone
MAETVELKIEGMSCGHCEQAVKKALEGVPGVRSATVSAAKGRATVEVEPGRSDRAAMARAVVQAGYRVA